MLLAVGSAVAISFCTELGALRIKGSFGQAIAPHLAWITSGACLLLCVLALRGRTRTVLAALLLTVGGGSVLGFIALPAFGLPLIPVPQEIARARHRNGDLVGYRIYSLYRPLAVVVCQEVQIFGNLYWNDLLTRERSAFEVQFEAGKNRVWNCHFSPLHPGQPSRSRPIHLPH